MNFYAFHIGDYAAHTKHLTPMEDLAFRRMLDLYYTSEKPLPLDVAKIARLIGMRDHTAEIADVLSDFFIKTDNGYCNKRCDAEIERARETAEESNARRENEKERQRRHRTRRHELFEKLREHGIVPSFETATETLQKMLVTAQSQPVTRDATANHNHNHTQSHNHNHVNNQTPKTGNPVLENFPAPEFPETGKTGKTRTRPTKPKNSFADIALPACIPRDVWIEFDRFRQGRPKRAEWTQQIAEYAVKELVKLHEAGSNPADVIGKSISSSSVGLFPVYGSTAKPAPQRYPSKAERIAENNRRAMEAALASDSALFATTDPDTLDMELTERRAAPALPGAPEPLPDAFFDSLYDHGSHE